MTAIMRYKGYTAEVAIDDEADILFGRVIDVKDVITFQGITVAKARQAFHDSVDDYLEFCAELGEEPDKPFSGKLPFRTTPKHHRDIAIAARMAGKSINAWMEDTLTQAAEKAINRVQLHVATSERA
jgi:predicted HicB family RNase H-like nuclease